VPFLGSAVYSADAVMVKFRKRGSL
jgi:hypothetical protein